MKPGNSNHSAVAKTENKSLFFIKVTLKSDPRLMPKTLPNGT